MVLYLPTSRSQQINLKIERYIVSINSEFFRIKILREPEVLKHGGYLSNLSHSNFILQHVYDLHLTLSIFELIIKNSDSKHFLIYFQKLIKWVQKFQHFWYFSSQLFWISIRTALLFLQVCVAIECEKSAYSIAFIACHLESVGLTSRKNKIIGILYELYYRFWNFLYFDVEIIQGVNNMIDSLFWVKSLLLLAIFYYSGLIFISIY